MFALYQIVTAAILGLALGFGGGWTTNGWRLSATISKIEKNQSDAVTAGVTQALNETLAYQRKKDEALKIAERRAVSNANDAAVAGPEFGKVGTQLATNASSIDRATHDSLKSYATSISDVFDKCVNRYQAVADQATKHASDVDTLVDSWPKKETK